MSTVKANTYQDASGGSNAILYGAASPAGSMGFRNRIINGDMRIDQRNAGAAVTVTAAFPVDRFFVANSTDGAWSVQQDSSAPTGFVNSLKFTTTTADETLTTIQNINVGHRIEGTNIADLAWGTANAKTVTLSFWVRSSLTGTFGGALRNSTSDRSYPYTYTISVANTWEQKSVTIAGDTTGTWLTTNGIGIQVFFGLGAGPDRSGTAGAWAGAAYSSATGATSVIGTLNATWYVTGVQLEVGSVATEFERRPYGTELALCQRYYEKSFSQGTAPVNSFSGEGPLRDGYGGWIAISGSSIRSHIQKYAVVKRTTPTITAYSPSTIGTSGQFAIYNSGWAATSGLSASTNDSFIAFEAESTVSVTSGQSYLFGGGWAASAEL